MCDWRKLLRRVTSRPEIEISDKRLAFSSQTSSIEPSYKTGPKQVKMSISPIAQGFLKIFRVQNVALTVRRPKHPSLVWCTGIFQGQNRTIGCILDRSARLYGDCMEPDHTAKYSLPVLTDLTENLIPKKPFFYVLTPLQF